MKRILIAPLDWGLGHATRCIPIIQQLLERDCQVIIAADKRPLALLREEFPHLEHVVLPGYDISYPDSGSMIGKMIFSMPKILLGIKREHSQLKKIIKDKKIDGIISDNRYGLYNSHVPCVFITHQLFIQSPIFSSLLRKKNFNYINKFNECWVPDIENENNLSGDLSHGSVLPGNTHYIGNLSRFNTDSYRYGLSDHHHTIDLVCIISGPEPQRTAFEKMILEQTKELDHQQNLKVLIIQGKPEENSRKFISQHIELISHMNAEELNKTLLSTKLVISRPGYSTLMDLAALNKKAVFIPTPGQTEQEYLAKKLKKEKIAFSIEQSKFHLKEAVNESLKYTGFNKLNQTNYLEKRIKEWLAEIKI